MAEETCDPALTSEVGLHLQDWGGGTRKVAEGKKNDSGATSGVESHGGGTVSLGCLHVGVG